LVSFLVVHIASGKRWLSGGDGIRLNYREEVVIFYITLPQGTGDEKEGEGVQRPKGNLAEESKALKSSSSAHISRHTEEKTLGKKKNKRREPDGRDPDDKPLQSQHISFPVREEGGRKNTASEQLNSG